MIISASRRTDIPAFYAEWLMNRIRAGYCTVPNPFNRQQIALVSLKPEDVDVLVFWTRNPRPLFPYLAELDQRGYRYYFQYTILNNPRLIDIKTPPLASALDTFLELARRVGSNRVIWRYDPIVFTPITGADFHRKTYTQIAQALRGATRRSVISILDEYPKTRKRLLKVAQDGTGLFISDPTEQKWFGPLIQDLACIAAENKMEIVSCAEQIDLQPYGVRAGKCVDDDIIQEVFGIQVGYAKDPSQRPACGCGVSKDIGMYDSCLFGCQYCYATNSFERAKTNHAQHDPHSPSLIAWVEVAPHVSIPHD